MSLGANMTSKTAHLMSVEHSSILERWHLKLERSNKNQQPQTRVRALFGAGVQASHADSSPLQDPGTPCVPFSPSVPAEQSSSPRGRKSQNLPSLPLFCPLRSPQCAEVSSERTGGERGATDGNRASGSPSTRNEGCCCLSVPEQKVHE